VVGIPDFVSGATVGFMKKILSQKSVAIIQYVTVIAIKDSVV
jgi:hypothetical protein